MALFWLYNKSINQSIKCGCSFNIEEKDVENVLKLKNELIGEKIFSINFFFGIAEKDIGETF